ncbi:MAG: PDZ domain-containing protein [Acidobacteriota bacterium]|nr:PDZ domain-containing protein [Acidobacteriota bacterium]
MHARTWLSVLSLPLVGAVTYPVLQQRASAPETTAPKVAPDPLAGLTDIQDVLSLVQRDYVDRPDMGKVLAGGIQAVLERAHPLNAYLSPEDLRLPSPGPASAGLVAVKRGIYAQVLAVTPGGPAAQAGIQPGDVIRKVDGDSVGLLSAWTLERRLRGEPGTPLDLYRYSTLTGDLVKSSLKLEVLPRQKVSIQKATGGIRIALPDLDPGRTQEVRALLAGVDRKQALVLDLRQCVNGSAAEAAALAGFLGVKGTVGTLQQAGKPDEPLAAGPLGTPFASMAVLIGRSTLGMPEVLAACLKKNGARILGERTPGLAVVRGRFPLRQGGAVELVYGRWVGDGGEKLDRQGLVPDQTLKLEAADDPLAKALDALKTPLPTPAPAPTAHKAA